MKVKILFFLVALFLLFGCSSKPSFVTESTIHLEISNFDFEALKYWNGANPQISEYPLDNCNTARRLDAVTWQVSLKNCAG